MILTGKEKHGDYLKVLILSDQLLPGKNLISLDAFKAVLSLFILKNKVLQLTSALSLNAQVCVKERGPAELLRHQQVSKAAVTLPRSFPNSFHNMLTTS